MCSLPVVPRGVAYLDTWLKYPAVHDYTTIADGAACRLPADASPCDVAETLSDSTCASDNDAVDIMAATFPLLICRPSSFPFAEIWSPEIADILLLLAVGVTMLLYVLVSLKDIFVQP